MSDVVIEVQHLSKLYQLGTIGSGSLRQDIKHWWLTKVAGKEDPFFTGSGSGPNSFIWALNDVSFEVKRGDAVGIIGSNGAGKSTLLKIVSRIVKPTKGFVKGKGKVGSLLEVGTGFNPELTGRENIFISGYLLGMKKQEIRSKFDEIVAFSGIEKFIDTPVKRYSSGMYIRLAFAVSAHLEPEILIVDEVLAVGDADFQKRCLGKMADVSSTEGRTILFVSHNLPAIANLCNRAIWLQQGKIRDMGNALDIVNAYTSNFKRDNGEHWDLADAAPGNELVRLKSLHVGPDDNKQNKFISVNTPIRLEAEFWNFMDKGTMNVNVVLNTNAGVCVFNMGTGLLKAEKGVVALQTVLPAGLLNNLSYSITLTVNRDGSTVYEFKDCIGFDVEDLRQGIDYFGVWQGIIRPANLENFIYLKEKAISNVQGATM